MKFKLPKPDEPGFLRRKKECAAKFVASQMSDEGFDKYVEYLAQYIEADDPVEAALDLTSEQVKLMHAAIMSGTEVDPEQSGNSAGG